MESNLCIECKKRPIEIKKRQLCRYCYQILRKQTGAFLNPETHQFTKQTIRKHKLSREIEFIKNFFSHTNYTHQPAVFKLNGEYYRPDFFDIERNTFIEVSGTRQAYHANKHKYDLFRKLYPKLNFEIRKPTGDLLNEASRDKEW